MSLVLEVRGMTCQHCVTAITTAVHAVPGTTGVDVDLASNTVRVDGDPDRAAVTAAISDAGYDIGDGGAPA